jgi:hypothetical protein
VGTGSFECKWENCRGVHGLTVGLCQLPYFFVPLTAHCIFVDGYIGMASLALPYISI